MIEFTIRALYVHGSTQRVQYELDKDVDTFFLEVSQIGLRTNIYINSNYICFGTSIGSFTAELNRSQVMLLAETIRNKDDYVQT